VLFSTDVAPIHKTRVAIVKGTDPFKTTNHALKHVQNKIIIKPGDCALIKPNLVSPIAPDKGITTDAGVVDAIIEFLRLKGVEDIVIADGGDPGTEKTFRVTGLKDLSRKHGVETVNLNKDTWEEIPIPGSLALKKVKVAKTVLRSDCIINVPKLKIHHMAQVTLSLKNLMGVVVDKRGLLMHHKLDEKIVDLASLFKPILNVVDGIVGSEMDEVLGSPVESNVIIAGVDMVSVDTVGSAVMGLDPNTVRHIQLAAGRGLGVSNLDHIEIIGDPIEDVTIKYSTEYSAGKLKTYGLAHPLSKTDIANMKKSFTKRDPHLKDLYNKKEPTNA